MVRLIITLGQATLPENVFANRFPCESPGTELPDWIGLRNVTRKLRPILYHASDLLLTEGKISSRKICVQLGQPGQIAPGRGKTVRKQSFGDVSWVRSLPAWSDQPQPDKEKKKARGDQGQSRPTGLKPRLWHRKRTRLG